MLQTLAAALGAAALLFFTLGSWAVLRALHRLRFVETTTEAIAPQDVPPEVRSLLAPSATRLAELGFVEAAAMRLIGQVIDGGPQPQYALVFTHPTLPAAAFLMQQISAQRDRDDTVQFASLQAGGMGLVTRNRVAISGALPLPHVVTHDCWLPSWAALWQAHQQRMQQLQPDAAQWQVLEGAQAVALSAHSEAQVFRIRVARGDWVAAEGGTWRPGVRFSALALTRAWRWLLPSMKRMPADGPAGPPAATTTAATTALVDAYERDLREQSASRWSSGAKWLLFAVSGALAMASFNLAMNLGTLLALMLVLVFHELGHFVAMRWAGYQDLKVFFLPFLGAAVSGRHEQPTLRQELIVLYAGPLPGLVLGVAALLVIDPATSPAAWWRELATLAIVLNALNLLPIHPLDGGKVFELLLLARWPGLAFAARLAGMAALALLAVQLESGPGRIALLALALLMSLGIGHLWREARVARALQKSGQWGGLERRAALAALFERIAALGYGALPQTSQRLMVGALLPGLTRAPLRPAARIGGTLLYGALVLGAMLAVAVQAFVGLSAARQFAQSARLAASATSAAEPHNAAEVAQRWADERTREIEDLRRRADAEADPQRRWLLIEPELQAIAGHVASDESRLGVGRALLHDARDLAPKLADAPAAVATAEMALSAAAGDDAARLRHIDAALAAYDAPVPPDGDPTPLLQATTLWLDANTRTSADQCLTRVERTLAIAGARGESSERQALAAAHADLLLALGQRERAFGVLHQAVQEALQEALQEASKPIVAAAAARALIDATWADQDAAAALLKLDALLPGLGARSRGEHDFALDNLIRHGMWLAEDAGRRDWQRAHVDALVAAHIKAADMAFWLRALRWWHGAGSGDRTQRDLEHAHWRGDGEEAQRIGAELRHRVPGFTTVVHGYHGSQRVVGPRVGERIAALRRALAKRYQLPVREAPALSEPR